MITLSRIPVVGNISNHTPRTVIQEIAIAHGLDYDCEQSQDYRYHCRMVMNILKHKVLTVKPPFNERDWIKIAKFVSPSLPIKYWPELNSKITRVNVKHTLTEAFKRHLEFRETIHFDFSNDIEYGEMSPINLKRFDACMLYRYCGLRQFNLDWRSSISDMIDMITTDVHVDVHTIKERIIGLIDRIDVPKRSLINALHSLSPPGSILRLSPPSPNFNFAELRITDSNVQSTKLSVSPVTERKSSTTCSFLGKSTSNIGKGYWKGYGGRDWKHDLDLGEHNIDGELNLDIEAAPDVLSSFLQFKVELSKPIVEIKDEVILDDNGRYEQLEVYDVETENIDRMQERLQRELLKSPDIMNLFDHAQLQQNISQIIQITRTEVEIDAGNNSIDQYLAHLSGAISDDQSLIMILHNRLKNIKVRDHCTAVIHMACNYLLDVSTAESPLTEYYRYLNHDGMAIDYCPASDKLLRRMEPQQKYIDGIAMSHVFNPYLDMALYSTQSLRGLATYYGLDSRLHHSALYHTLQEATLLDTFHPGIIDLNNRDGQTETPIILEEIDDLEPWEAVSYGNRVDGYQVITYSELDGMFNREGYFRMVTDDKDCLETYTSEQINHLRIISSRNLYDLEPEDNILIRHNLVQTIDRIMISNRNMTPAEIRMLNHYRHSDQNREVVHLIMDAFLDLTMKMRGWNGRGPYPIARIPACDQIKVYMNVNSSFARYDKHCEEHPEVCQLFESLPLYRYNKNQDIYIISNLLDDGFTIGDRLEIVRQGETTTNINSCIRMTSNWFLATYSHLCIMLDRMGGFDLRQMREIA